MNGRIYVGIRDSLNFSVSSDVMGYEGSQLRRASGLV
ncbi:hypothetical protein JOC54_001108 [Alkalihalobacillus xiaoxiensis]|uniref:Uncharacterized protein n=1 Tax=Shouchella xiaoxiensis TaxID=766895 RepID=A0ABS2SQS3_9BACI|nr:hypothetical protein [Shouchella xiaoxiensis]